MKKNTVSYRFSIIESILLLDRDRKEKRGGGGITLSCTDMDISNRK